MSTFKLEVEICVIIHRSSQQVRNKITALKISGRLLWNCCVIPSVKVSVSVAIFCSPPLHLHCKPKKCAMAKEFWNIQVQIIFMWMSPNLEENSFCSCQMTLTNCWSCSNVGDSKISFARWKMRNILFTDMCVLQLLATSNTFTTFSAHEA